LINLVINRYTMDSQTVRLVATDVICTKEEPWVCARSVHSRNARAGEGSYAGKVKEDAKRK